MTLTIDEIRDELPVTRQLAYLNTGTNGPLPRRTHEAIVAEAARQLHQGRSNFDVFMNEYFPLLQALRDQVARLIHAREGEIALTHHTTEGMNIATWGVRWQPGDEIVTTTQEHEGGLMPVYAAAHRFGLTVRVVELGAGDDWAERLVAAINDRTRLVVLSHVSWKNGRILPLPEVAAAAHRVGALVAVDGAQAAGATPVDVHALGVDAYALPGQKWLCGPEGVGALWVHRERLADFAPTFVGIFGLRAFGEIDHLGQYILAPDARRYETSSVYWPALYGMHASLSWLEETVGWPSIFERAHAITRRCRAMLAGLPGVTLHSPDDPTTLSTFRVEGVDTEEAATALVEFLRQRGVVIRSLHKPGFLRASTGFFTHEEDLARLAEGIEAYQSMSAQS